MSDTVPTVELTNANGCSVQISAMGCSVLSLRVPDRMGQLVDVVLGYEHLADYQRNALFLGCVVGPYAGRIDGGKFLLNGTPVQLAVDASGHHLHGGEWGLHRRVWELLEQDVGSATFSCATVAGEGGYPAGIHVLVRYTLDHRNRLQIAYEAQTGAATVINLTNHSYFNLGGHDQGRALDQYLTIASDRYALLREDLVPTGEFADVRGTPMDFTRSRRIGRDINQAHSQLRYARGYDHGWMLNERAATGQRPAAVLYAASTGISMAVYTDQPSIQFYSGNFLPDDWRGKGGSRYGAHQGVCLETQHLPNSPNQPGFPSTVLDAGQTFRSSTWLEFYSDAPDGGRHERRV